MTTNDLLSEGELDALMSATSASAGQGGWLAFDFTAREQSLLAQFTQLPGLHQRQAEQLAIGLGRLFASEFEAVTAGLRVTSCDELRVSLEETLAVTTIQLMPLAGQCHVICSAPLLSQLVNDYFGGVRGFKISGPRRGPLTPSELRLGERVAEKVIESLCSAWSEKIPLEPGVGHTLPHIDALAALPAAEKMVQIIFEVTLSELSSQVILIIPLAALEPWKQRFTAPRKSAGDDSSGWAPHLRQQLPLLSVDIVAMLTSHELTLGEVLALKVGSVIDLSVPDKADLCVEGVRLASGGYGAFERNKAIKITKFAEPELSGMENIGVEL